MEKVELLKSVLNDGNSASFGEMTAEVEQKCRKTGNPLRDTEVTKLVTYNILFNAVYQNMVNNRREKEGVAPTFQSQANWFVKMFDTKNGSLVCHAKDNTRHYLFFACNYAKTHHYLVDGLIATPEQTKIINEFRIVSAPPKNQGVENPIIVRTVKVDNIRELKCHGVKVKF